MRWSLYGMLTKPAMVERKHKGIDTGIMGHGLGGTKGQWQESKMEMGMRSHDGMESHDDMESHNGMESHDAEGKRAQ